MLGRLSRVLNALTGGSKDQTLCARMAHRDGSDCLFCRVVGLFTNQDHCADELRRWLNR